MKIIYGFCFVVIKKIPNCKITYKKIKIKKSNEHLVIKILKKQYRENYQIKCMNYFINTKIYAI